MWSTVSEIISILQLNKGMTGLFPQVENGDLSLYINACSVFELLEHCSNPDWHKTECDSCIGAAKSQFLWLKNLY